jgi:class 3 adenylate cyclase
MTTELMQTCSNLKAKQRKMTVLFTDIVDSTKIWDKLGDVETRQLLERHNRLLFPVVRAFRGTVIKTIGDSIMARFKNPRKAVQAAVAMQQILLQEQKTTGFPLHVRIGVHYGVGLLEKNDIYGDVVNVASRVESQAQADEILLSDSVYAYIKNQNKTLPCVRAGSFVPKGKSTKLTYYRCKWTRAQNFSKQVALHSYSNQLSGQLRTMVAGIAAISGGAWLFYFYYLRYFLADFRWGALFLLSPKQALIHFPLVFVALLAAIAFAIWKTRNLRIAPLKGLKILRGCLWGFIAGGICWGVSLLPTHFEWQAKLNQTVYSSHHLFVSIVTDSIQITEHPGRGDVLQMAYKDQLYLLMDVKHLYSKRYNRIWLGKSQSQSQSQEELYGWIPRKVRNENKKWERVSIANPFTVHKWDLYMLGVALLSAVLGYVLYRTPPVQ